MRISDWSSDVCSSDLCAWGAGTLPGCAARRPAGGSAATLPRRGDLSGGAGCGSHAGAFLPGLVPAFLRGGLLMPISYTSACRHTEKRIDFCAGSPYRERLLASVRDEQIGRAHV